MVLESGTRLGPYEIVAPLGAGGMGEVYEARDGRLDRTVAIKVLAPSLAGDPRFRERFEREARSIAALSHPHICTLHDIGQHNGTAFLVMEYLHGRTLADRLVTGALPLGEALKIAIEIAGALDKAHRQGIVHRDLKPGNVMLTRSGAKLLDFGLAKAVPAIGATGGSMVQTESEPPLTGRGTVLGTFQYMAPEQIEGDEADARTDIFAFGVVLYEMVSGRKAFTGRTAASLFGAILTKQPPPLSTVRSITPRPLDQLVHACLEKDREERIQTMYDVLLQLRWIVDAAPPQAAAAPGRRSRTAWIVAAALGLIAAVTLAAAVVQRRTAPIPGPPVRFTIAPPDGTVFSRTADVPAISPDGRHVLFLPQGGEARHSLWLRPIDSVAARPVTGTEGGVFPFWSPDSRSFAFWADGRLKRIDLTGGPAQTLAETAQVYGGAWNQRGDILFTTLMGPIMRTTASGGDVRRVTTLDAARQETQHRWPSFLPDGRHFVYLARSSQSEQNGVFVAALDSAEVRPLVPVDSAAVYAPSGHLLYVRADILMAHPFDASAMRRTGEPFQVAAPIAPVGASGGRAFSVSSNGVLAYRTGSSLALGQLVWFDRTGRRLGTLGERGDYSNPALSPDGQRVAVSLRDSETRTRDIWLFDVGRGSSTRFTFDAGDDLNPIFSRDGARILFSSSRKGGLALYVKAATGVGEEEPVFQGEHPAYANDWSPDSRLVVYDTGSAAVPSDLWVAPLDGNRRPTPFLVRPFIEIQARISPDGRWIAYSSNESGRYEVYVQDFPKPSARWQVSTQGGWEPMWSAGGNELFFLSGRRMMAADVRTDGPRFRAAVPRALFEASIDQRVLRNRYVVTPDSKRFLMVGEDEQPPSRLIAVVNWRH